jgi:hypothetical protein
VQISASAAERDRLDDGRRLFRPAEPMDGEGSP